MYMRHIKTVVIFCLLIVIFQSACVLAAPPRKGDWGLYWKAAKKKYQTSTGEKKPGWFSAGLTKILKKLDNYYDAIQEFHGKELRALKVGNEDTVNILKNNGVNKFNRYYTIFIKKNKAYQKKLKKAYKKAKKAKKNRDKNKRKSKALKKIQKSLTKIQKSIVESKEEFDDMVEHYELRMKEAKLMQKRLKKAKADFQKWYKIVASEKTVDAQIAEFNQSHNTTAVGPLCEALEFFAVFSGVSENIKGKIKVLTKNRKIDPNGKNENEKLQLLSTGIEELTKDFDATIREMEAYWE